jgi:THO complex subunit 7
MGELSEGEKDRVKSKKKIKEDLEEGEASDEGSELMEPPE